MSLSTVAKGREAEALVRAHLESRGWLVVAHNWRAGRLELDLVAESGQLLVFIEVKRRNEDAVFDPRAALRPAQRRRLVTASRLFLDRHPAWRAHYCRFDVVFVIRETKGGTRLEHVENAYQAA